MHINTVYSRLTCKTQLHRCTLRSFDRFGEQINSEALKPHCYNRNMLPLCRWRWNTAGSLVWILCAPSSHFYMRRGLKDRWSEYRFPHSIFRQTLSTPSLSAPFFLFRNVYFSSPVFRLHSAPSNFCSLTFCLYLSDLACTTALRWAPYIRVEEGEGTFKSPLLPFLKIP